MDGVFADMDAALAREARLLFGDAPNAAPSVPDETPDIDADVAGDGAPADADPAETVPSGRVLLTQSQQRKLWRQVRARENFWESLEELDRGSVERLARLADERRWEVIFLTKRPETAGFTSQRQTQHWLVAHGFPLPSVYVVQGSRGRIAASLALDIVVDDRPENCLDVCVDSKARALLVWRHGEPPPATKRLGIGAVKTVDECLDLLVEADTPPAGRTGVIGRVLQMLGLKESSGA